MVGLPLAEKIVDYLIRAAYQSLHAFHENLANNLESCLRANICLVSHSSRNKPSR